MCYVIAAFGRGDRYLAGNFSCRLPICRMKPVGTCEHIPRSATMNEIKYKLTETLKTSNREADDVLEIILEKARPICCSLQVKLIK